MFCFLFYKFSNLPMGSKDKTVATVNSYVQNIQEGLDIRTNRVTKRMFCFPNSLTSTNYKVKLCLLIVLLHLSHVHAVPCREGCRNKGIMIMPTSLFGYCRCVCVGPYAGPACEFKTKRRIKIRKLIKIKGTLREIIQRLMEQRD